MNDHPQQGQVDQGTRAPMQVRTRIGEVADSVLWLIGRRSSRFWDLHYALRGTSGPGSRGLLAEHKAEIVNRLVLEREVSSIVELGCGDGYQAALLTVNRYLGLDVSRRAVERCVRIHRSHPGKTFLLYDEKLWCDTAGLLTADMALSMDVIFHLVEDEAFESYMTRLFSLGRRLVLVYSSDCEESRKERPYTRQRSFSDWVTAHAPDWEQAATIDNPHGELTASSFILYQRRPDLPE